MVDLTTRLGAVTLKNPIMPASGTFSEDLAGVIDMNALGAHVTKTITYEKRGGNPTPRVCEVRGSMLNSIGIPSKGIAHFIQNVIPYYRDYDVPLIVSISAHNADDFARSARRSRCPAWMPSRSIFHARISKMTARPLPCAPIRPDRS